MRTAPRTAQLPLHLVRLIRWGLALVPLTALIVTRPSPYAYSLGKSVFFRIVVEIVAALYVALVVADRSVRRFWPTRGALTWSLIAYVGAVQVTTLLSLDRAQSWWGTLERMGGAFTTLHLLALFLVLAGVLRLAVDWRILLHGWLASSVVVAIVAAEANFFQNHPRPGSTLGGSTYLATYALFQIFFGVCVLVMEKSRWGRRWGAFCVALNLFTLGLTATRGAIIGLAAGLFATAVLVMVCERGRPRLRVAAVLTLILLLAAPAALRLGRGSALFSRTLALGRLSVISPDDATTRSRLILLSVSWNAFKARPIAGYGPEMYLLAYGRYFNPQELTYEQGWFDHAHNTVADVAVMEGLIGLLSYLAIFIAAGWLVLKALRRASPYRLLIIAAFGMLVAYFVQNLGLFDMPVSSILLYSSLAFIVFLTRTPDSVADPTPTAKGKKKPAPPLIPALGGRQRAMVACVALVMAACVYLNLAGFAQAESAIDLADEFNNPTAFLAGFRQVLDYRAWPTDQLVLSAADELAGSAAIKSPAFADAAQAVITEMEARAAKHGVYDPRFYISLGTLYNELAASDPSLLPRAEAALRKAAELAPRWPDTYDAMAVTRLIEGQTDAALDLLKQAVELNPENGQARWYYAFVLIDRGRQKEGFEQLAAALPHYNYHSPRDLSRLSHAYYRAGDLPNAIRFEKELVGMQPDNPAQHAALAQLYKESGDATDALREIGIAAQLDGSYSGSAQEFIKSLGTAVPSGQ